MFSDPRPEYWREYSGFQWAKHRIIEFYLGGWYPKLASWARRVVYVDTHAGRGRHEGDQAGSPLVALTTLLEHASRERIMDGTEVRFVFVERDAANVAALREAVAALGELPSSMAVGVQEGECFALLEGLLDDIDSSGDRMAPSFVFVDPYGFAVPGRLLRRLMQHRHVEVFVNVMWRELDMAIQQVRDADAGGMVELLNAVFDGDSWRDIASEDVEKRAQQCVDLLADMCAAKWATTIRMLGENGRTRYLLMHLTNHDAGRDLMKAASWSASPESGFVARRSDTPDRPYLMTPEPNLIPLRKWVIDQLSAGPKKWSALDDALRGTLWLESHLSSVLRGMRNEGTLEASGYDGRFAKMRDPVFKIRAEGDSR